jgi:peptide-methionine (S)-S-oxide reductase
MSRIIASLLLAAGLGLAPAAAEDGAPVAGEQLATATFAGGSMHQKQPPYDRVEGVISTTSGYIGGHVPDPTYEQVSAGGTGHAEAVQVVYDPDRVSYQDLLFVFWRNVDPTTPDRQFCDVGDQYRTAIFWHDEEQQRLAESSREELDKTKPFAGEIVTEIVPAGEFYPAEEYHQDYYRKNPARYKFYRYLCGRDARLAELWGAQAGAPES